MKRPFFRLLALPWALMIVSMLRAQMSGQIVYQKIIDYGIEPMGKPRWDNYIKSLPKKGTFIYTLSFKGSESLFEEDLSKREQTDPRLQRALNAIPSFTPPKVKVQKIYQNIEKGDKVEEVEFMTRYFIVENKLEQHAWKITPNKKKILDYICSAAKLDTDSRTITAWFTSEIPVSFGPDNYHGLPGLILGIEIDGDMVILASEINLNPIDPLNIPDKGQKIQYDTFTKIVDEKIEEWKTNSRSRTGKKGRG